MDRRENQWIIGLAALALLMGCADAGEPVGESSGALHDVDRETVCFVPRGDRSIEHEVELPSGLVDRIVSRSLSYRGPCADYGEAEAIGTGTFAAFAQIDDANHPVAIGVAFPGSFFDGAPTAPSEGKHCYDLNGDGVEDLATECVGGHERVLYFPSEFNDGVDSPFDWMMINWNPHGHPPPHIYGAPHFDFHFYMQEEEDVYAIGVGTCPVIITDCDDFARGTIPVPDQYVPEGYADLGAVEPAMGNHLLDLTSPEFAGEPFTHTFIYGAFDGHITFWEPMITQDFIESVAAGSLPSTCYPIKQPAAFEVGGYYPTSYCIRYRDNRDEHTITLEGFVHRTAS